MRHLEWFAQPGVDGLVFVGERGAVLRGTTFGRKWRRARDKAGLTTPSASPSAADAPQPRSEPPPGRLLRGRAPGVARPVPVRAAPRRHVRPVPASGNPATARTIIRGVSALARFSYSRRAVRQALIRPSAAAL